MVASDISFFTSDFYFFQVFSAFGFVHKIATFEKAAGFQVSNSYVGTFLHYSLAVSFSFPVLTLQALIQFSDAETASSARNALDGRSIPRYSMTIFFRFMDILKFANLVYSKT